MKIGRVHTFLYLTIYFTNMSNEEDKIRGERGAESSAGSHYMFYPDHKLIVRPGSYLNSTLQKSKSECIMRNLRRLGETHSETQRPRESSSVYVSSGGPRFRLQTIPFQVRPRTQVLLLSLSYLLFVQKIAYFYIFW